jgi:putative ABC transport system substrate-binding protein
MRRRNVLGLLAGTVALPAPAIAQGSSRTPKIGILMLGAPDPSAFLQEFNRALRDLDYVDGRNVAVEARNANGSQARLSSLAGELAALKVDVIVGYQTPAVAAAKAATAKIPIVMCPAQEPIEMGFVKSFARPGGNVTGMTTGTAEITGKNLDLIRDALPTVRRLGVIGNAIDPFHKSFLESAAAAASKLGFQLKTILTRGEALDSAFAELARDRTEAVLVQPSLPHEPAIAAARKIHLPLFSPSAEIAAAGGLMSYSAEMVAVYRQAATFVDLILKGRKPADLPVQLATRFLLVVNLKTASALGLTLPPTLLARADEVIE